MNLFTEANFHSVQKPVVVNYARIMKLICSPKNVVQLKSEEKGLAI